MSTNPKNTATTPIFKVKAGGAKGQAIVDIITKEPGLSRAQVAEKAGATVGRVGEVIRFLAAQGSPAEKKAVAAHTKAQSKNRANAGRKASSRTD